MSPSTPIRPRRRPSAGDTCSLRLSPTKCPRRSGSNWTFTPKLSLQFYGQPLISAGAYSDYKALARPRSFAFSRWNDGTSSFDSATFTPPTPDFNLKSLRGNAVLRWEYLP